MGRVGRTDTAVALVSLPVVVLAIGWLAALVLAAGGPHPIWTVEPRNPAEAAAFRDGGTLVRATWTSEDLNAAGEVRPDIISARTLTITPLEAAVRAGRSEMVRLLFDLGVRPDAGSWTSAWCQAESDEIRTILEAYRPAGAGTACSEAG